VRAEELRDFPTWPAVAGAYPAVAGRPPPRLGGNLPDPEPLVPRLLEVKGRFDGHPSVAAAAGVGRRVFVVGVRARLTRTRASVRAERHLLARSA